MARDVHEIYHRIKERYDLPELLDLLESTYEDLYDTSLFDYLMDDLEKLEELLDGY